MSHNYPTLEDAGISVPGNVIAEDFRAGWDHSIRGGNLSERAHFKKSFRYGFREARMYLDEVRRSQRIIPFPMKGQMIAK